MTRFPFALYRCAWTSILPFIAALAALDGRLRRRGGAGIIPRTWRVTERMCYPGAAPAAVPQRRALWMHCASLGEAKGLWAFALSLADAPDLALTAATDDGAAWLEARCAETRGTLGPDRRITASIAPFDHPVILRRFLDAHGALGLCLYEAELWPNALAACRELGVPATLVSGRLTARAQRWYRRFGGAGARLLDGLAWIQAQSPLDRDRFVSLTRTEVLVGCDFKAAHFLAPSGAPRASEARYRFAFLSLHYRELVLLLPGLPALMARTPLIVFPRKLRELDRFRALLRPLHFRLHSRDPGARHVLVDSMGRIGELLPSCHSAFVGGSLVPKGCHNLWEPLLAGCRIHFGSHFASQESLAERVMARGIGAVLADPRRIGSLPFPGPEKGRDKAPVPEPDLAQACDGLIRDLRQGLDSALLEGGRRIFATFYPQAIAGRNRGEKVMAPASGKDKGYQR